MIGKCYLAAWFGVGRQTGGCVSGLNTKAIAMMQEECDGR